MTTPANTSSTPMQVVLDFPLGVSAADRGVVARLLPAAVWTGDGSQALQVRLREGGTVDEVLRLLARAGLEVREHVPEVELEVEGMMCQHSCGTTVTNALLAVPGVRWASASYEAGNAVVRGTAPPEALVEAVENVGFGAKLVVVAAAAPPPARRENAKSKAMKDDHDDNVSPLPPSRKKRHSSSSSLATAAWAAAATTAPGLPPRAGPEDAGDEETASLLVADHAIASPAKETMVCAVRGMSCAACVSSIEDNIGKLRGVSSVRVALIAEKARITFNPGEISPEAISNAISAIGYPASIKSVGQDDLWTESHWLFSSSVHGNDERAVNALKSMPGISSVSVDNWNENPRLVRVKYDSTQIGPRKVMTSLQAFGDAQLARGKRARKTRGQGHNRNDDDDDDDEDDGGGFRKPFLGSLLFTIPIVIISMVLPSIPGLGHILMTPILPGLTLDAFLLLALAIPVQFYFGIRFYRNAYKALKMGAANMDVLVALGTTAAFAYALFSMILSMCFPNDADWQNAEHDAHFFETSAMLITFVLLGKYLEAKARARTAQEITGLMRLQVQTALLVADRDSFPVSERELSALLARGLGGDDSPVLAMERRVTNEIKDAQNQIDMGLIEVGDILKVLPGTRVPCDGLVIAGSSHVDEGILTGESTHVTKSAGDYVIGSSFNLNVGVLFLRVDRVGKDTALNQIVKLVEDAQTSKAPIQAQADLVAKWFVPIVVAIACLTWIVWFAVVFSIPNHYLLHAGVANEIVFAFKFGVAVLVVSCPCALGLATPTAVMVGTGVGATKLGILVKGGAAFEMGQNIKCVLFDKTGTLTHGRPDVADVMCAKGSVDRMLFLCGSAELGSEHPVGMAVVAYCQKEENASTPLSNPTKFEVTEGKGISCVVDDCRVHMGNRPLMRQACASESTHGNSNESEEEEDGDSPIIPLELEQWAAHREQSGMTVIFVAVNGRVTGGFAISDTVKPNSVLAIKALHMLGMDVWMVTGDGERTAHAIARQLGLPESRVLAGVLPNRKAAKVEELQRSGQVVAFVGDGVNDAPALAQADLGIALGAGTDVAMETADIVLVKSDPMDVANALDLSTKTLARIRLNFFLSFLYNIVCIPVAAGVLYPALMIRLPPALAGFMMAMSSVFVVVSSLMLNLYRKRNWVEEVRAASATGAGPGSPQRPRVVSGGFNGVLVIPIKYCAGIACLTGTIFLVLLLIVGIAGNPFGASHQWSNSNMHNGMMVAQERGEFRITELGDVSLRLTSATSPTPHFMLLSLDALVYNPRVLFQYYVSRSVPGNDVGGEEEGEGGMMMAGHGRRRRLLRGGDGGGVGQATTIVQVPCHFNVNATQHSGFALVRWTREEWSMSTKNNNNNNSPEQVEGMEMRDFPSSMMMVNLTATACCVLSKTPRSTQFLYSAGLTPSTCETCSSTAQMVVTHEDSVSPRARVPFKMVFRQPALSSAAAYFIHESGMFAHRCECSVTSYSARGLGECWSMVDLLLPGRYVMLAVVESASIASSEDVHTLVQQEFTVYV